MDAESGSLFLVAGLLYIHNAWRVGTDLILPTLETRS